MTSEQFYLYAIIFIVALLIAYVFIQFAHQIGKRNRYMEAQIKLLSKIAENQGVNKAEIEGILHEAGK